MPISPREARLYRDERGSASGPQQSVVQPDTAGVIAKVQAATDSDAHCAVRITGKLQRYREEQSFERELAGYNATVTFEDSESASSSVWDAFLYPWMTLRHSGSAFRRAS